MVWHKNEDHVSWRDGRTFVTGPYRLTMVNAKTAQPALSFGFWLGDQMSVIGRMAHEAHCMPEGGKVLPPRRLGFDLDQVPIEEGAKEFGL